MRYPGNRFHRHRVSLGCQYTLYYTVWQRTSRALYNNRIYVCLLCYLQFVPKLTLNVMTEIDTILGNKPVRAAAKDMTHNTNR